MLFEAMIRNKNENGMKQSRERFGVVQKRKRK